MGTTKVSNSKSDLHTVTSAIINLGTKFEVFMFIHYKDTKSNAKCNNWGGLGGFGSPDVIGNIAV